MPPTSDPAGEHPEDAAPAGSKTKNETLEDLNRLLEDVQAIGGRFFSTFSELLRAQWRLTAYILAGTARLWILRVVALMMVAVLLMTTWVFLNVTLWRAVAEFTELGFAPPLTVALLNAVIAGILFFWQQGLKLK